MGKMEIKVVDKEGRPLSEPYTLRLWGWTEERYLKEAPRDRKCEYARGEVILMSPMGKGHSEMVSFASFLLKGYCDFKYLGEILLGPTIRFLREVNREPDICFYPKEMLPLPEEIPLTKIPPFVLEVSLATRNLDLGEKAKDYEQAQVQEYWVVDLDEKELVVHKLQKGKYEPQSWREGRVESQVIQGFWIQAEWLFGESLPNSWVCLKRILGEFET
ncbi:MAG: Uma2 family endonuclease [Planctomycetota bacterium]|nr:MAG: Uma2 family endonuclease [Planctomycetota bacterium]